MACYPGSVRRDFSLTAGVPDPVEAMSKPSVHLCGREIPEGARHICAFVSSRDEQYDILAPFADEGLRQGERVLQIINPGARKDHAARMERAGADVASAERDGRLSIVPWDEAYLKDGHFDMHRMLGMLEAVVGDRKARGFPLLRAMADMDWALLGAPGTEQLLEYESRANFLTQQLQDVFLCFYDINKFPATTVVDIMRTHPAVIIGGVYHENPYYVPPQTLLQELVTRGKAKSA